ncbi:MAG: phosphoglycerate kinase [Bdellovibrio sp.]|nr:MAG: phosphoglycerate kinase [Bdellovibrio sp.]
MAYLDQIQCIDRIDIREKQVFLRLDLNVPLKDGVIQDDTRIQASLPTIRYALEQEAKLVLASHLGRPKGPGDLKRLSLEPVAQALGQLLGVEVIFVEQPNSEAPKALLPTLKPNQLILLENLRFDADETANGEGLAQAIAEYTEVYVNDAFGASHRAHASIVGVPALVKQKAMGFLIQKEVRALEKLLYHAESPFVILMGGAKVSDKIELIENLLDKSDALLVGGAMAYTFLKAQGVCVGDSLVEVDKVSYAKQLLERLSLRDEKLYLPKDHVVASHLEERPQVVEGEIPEGLKGFDIGPQTIQEYSEILKNARTIFWNGPMGVFEKETYSKGTFSLAKVIAENQQAFSLVGGGDSAAAAKASGYAEKMSHISTGGGASLEFLEGRPLPGLEALKKKNQ